MSYFGQQRPYRKVTDSGRSMALSTLTGHSAGGMAPVPAMPRAHQYNVSVLAAIDFRRVPVQVYETRRLPVIQMSRIL